MILLRVSGAARTFAEPSHSA
jgi:hypothetical protein